jgi:hypothetical protein
LQNPYNTMLDMMILRACCVTCFFLQLEPQRLMWGWANTPALRNLLPPSRDCVHVALPVCAFVTSAVPHADREPIPFSCKTPTSSNHNILVCVPAVFFVIYLQLEPQRLMWGWANTPALRNDFFQYVTHEGIGIGGAGHWAISLDEELLHGSSGPCDTFASPCLASKEEFDIIAVELWHVH